MLKVIELPIDEIVPYKNNVKLHPAEQIEQIKKSIQEFGNDDPIAIDENNVIIEGHGRLLALKDLGYEKAECIRIVGLSEDQKNAYRLVHNKLTMNSGFDLQALDDEVKKIQTIDIKQYDFDFDEIEKELSKLNDEEAEITEDDVPEPDEENEPETKLGDIYILGEHRLMCGDSTKKEDVERLMGGQKADMVFTDPPYGMNLDADFSGMVGTGTGNKYRNVIGDHQDFKPELIDTIFENFGYCKEIFTWGADYYAELIPERNKGSWIVWDKQAGGEGCNDRYDKMFGSNFELCWSKSKHKRAIARVLWKAFFGMQNEDTKRRVHPTQKPLELCKWFLEKFSKKGDLIVDIYGGSGSTLIACEKMGRRCFMSELDPRYCDVIVKRWENLTGKKAVKE